MKDVGRKSERTSALLSRYKKLKKKSTGDIERALRDKFQNEASDWAIRNALNGYKSRDPRGILMQQIAEILVVPKMLMKKAQLEDEILYCQRWVSVYQDKIDEAKKELDKLI